VLFVLRQPPSHSTGFSPYEFVLAQTFVLLLIYSIMARGKMPVSS